MRDGRQRDLDPQKAALLTGNIGTRASPFFVRFVRRFIPPELDTNTSTARGAFVVHDLCAQTATCSTTNDGVNDPVSTAWGHWRGRTAGSFTPSLVHRLRY